VLCEFLNFCVLVFNFCLTNIFLGHEFSTYGADVVKYYQYDQIARKEMVNPMCNIFPTRYQTFYLKKPFIKTWNMYIESGAQSVRSVTG
jgi:hypothetical protein